MSGSAEAASARACSSAPARGGSMSAASNAASSSGLSGRRKRSRVSAASLRRPRVVAAARESAAIAAASASAANTSRPGASLNAKAPEPQKRSATRVEFGERPLGEFREQIFAGFGRLEEAARRQLDDRFPERDARRPALDHDFAVVGDPRQVERVRRPCELLRFRALEWSRAAQVDVEPVERRRHPDVERRHQSPEIAAKRPRRGNRAGHAGAEQWAVVDRNDVVRAGAHEADLIGLTVVKTGVKGRPAPARAMGVDEFADLRCDALSAQRFDHEAALPLAIKRSRHVLRRAAAAAAVPAADRLGPFGRGAWDLDQLRPLALVPDQRPLAGQRARDDRSVRGDALAMGVKRDDRKLLERFSHDARRSGTPSRRRRRESATE